MAVQLLRLSLRLVLGHFQSLISRTRPNLFMLQALITIKKKETNSLAITILNSGHECQR